MGSDNGLAPNRWQAIIWTNDGLSHRCTDICVTGPQCFNGYNDHMNVAWYVNVAIHLLSTQHGGCWWPGIYFLWFAATPSEKQTINWPVKLHQFLLLWLHKIFSNMSWILESMISSISFLYQHMIYMVVSCNNCIGSNNDIWWFR